jgi:DNA modification methylase
VVTDPPYELGFMGKAWDSSGIAYQVDLWAEVLRVLKPGGHLLAFGGTRTYHRMAVAIEDAGFEIRDSIHWVYGSGFPKSLDVSKAIDKVNGEGGRALKFTEWMRTTGLTARRLDELTGTNMGGHYVTAKSQPAIPTAALWTVIRPHCGEVPEWVNELVARVEAEREVVGQHADGSAPGGFGEHRFTFNSRAITTAATDEARRWEGWGTALKPAHEPIVVARKPLIGTVAANVLQHGTGALNIDACRIGDPPGRWPANVIHDGSDKVTAMFPKSSGGAHPKKRNDTPNVAMSGRNYAREIPNRIEMGDSGSAARFFYAAKASRAERNAGLNTTNNHPTVKPIALMRYLLKLVTPPNGTTLDPFAGSGTTLIAAIHEGFHAIGIELTPEYHPIIQARIKHAQATRKTIT